MAFVIATASGFCGWSWAYAPSACPITQPYIKKLDGSGVETSANPEEAEVGTDRIERK